MPPPPSPEDHVPTQETLRSFSRPLLLKLKPFHVRPSKEHLAIFKGRPLAPAKLPFSKGMIWTRQELPALGLYYEYGFHISPKLVPVKKFVADRKWRKYRKRYYPPVPIATNLQSACIRTLHHSTGPRIVKHYHLQSIQNVPLLFAHTYSYDIYTKGDGSDHEMVNCYTLQLVIKYGAEYNSPLLRYYWTCPDYTLPPCLTNHCWALWNVYDIMYRMVQQRMLGQKALRPTHCGCRPCLYFAAMFEEARYTIQMYQSVNQAQLARLSYYEPDEDDLDHDCGSSACERFKWNRETSAISERYTCTCGKADCNLFKRCCTLPGDDNSCTTACYVIF